MKTEYDWSTARKAKRRSLPPAEDLDRHTKVRISILLDRDVLEYFRQEAAKGDGKYQTLINDTLRHVMEADKAADQEDLGCSLDDLVHRIQRIKRKVA